MRRLIRLVITFGLIFLLALGAFFLYGNLLVDYSLETLEVALSASAEESEAAFSSEKNVYRHLVVDMALEEVSHENPNIKDMLFLDFASRAIGETTKREGGKRASIYIKEVIESKQSERSGILHFFDKIYYWLKKYYQSFLSLMNYAQQKSRAQRVDTGEKQDYASLYILVQAEQKTNDHQYTEAIELYYKFLKFYPESKDRGFVAISLASILMRQNDYEQARKVLMDVKTNYLGLQEGQMAIDFLNRIDKLEMRKKLIEQLQQLIRRGKGEPEQLVQLKLKLALAYLSSYEFDEAESILTTLTEMKQFPEISQKAQFYLGWLYKLVSKLDKSAEVLVGLVDSPGLEEELSLGLHAQLADIYYLKDDMENALLQYQIVSGKADKMMNGLEAAESAWRSLAGIEQANIYYFDLGEYGRAGSVLSTVTARFSFSEQSALGRGMPMRERAFLELARGNVQTAFKLLERNLETFPRDPWTHSGLATIYLLFADLDKAYEFANKGYDWHKDEYTASALAYVHGYLGNYEEAARLYEFAVAKNKEYMPARFNLACMELELGEYAEAFEQLSNIINLLGDDQTKTKAKVLNNMGYALWWLGEKDDAIALFVKALKLDDSFDLAKMNLDEVQFGEKPEMANFKG